MFSNHLIIGGSGFSNVADAKGDLLVGSADNLVGRLPVGNNGQFLGTDSAAALGLVWRPPTFVHPPIVGDYFTFMQATRTASAPASGVLSLTPIWIPVAMTVDRIGCEVVASDATATIRLGIYQHDVATARPKNLLLDAGTVAGSTAAAVEITISQALSVGLYYLAVVAQGTITTLTTRRAATGPIGVPNSTSATAAYGASPQQCYSASGVTGALPSTFTVATTNTTPTVVYLRRSA